MRKSTTHLGIQTTYVFMYFPRGGRNPWNPQYTVAPLNDNKGADCGDVCPVWRHTMGNQ